MAYFICAKDNAVLMYDLPLENSPYTVKKLINALSCYCLIKTEKNLLYFRETISRYCPFKIL